MRNDGLSRLTGLSLNVGNRAQWYEGAGFGDRRWLHADERGSIVAVTNDAGNAIAINRYDEFGIPAAGNIGDGTPVPSHVRTETPANGFSVAA